MAPLNRRTRTLVVAAFLGGGLVAASHALILDGLDGLALRFALGDGAAWAANYSALGFWRVRQGMTPDEVLALTGEPLETYDVPDDAGIVGWRWTRNPKDTHHSVRVVLFTRGRVVEKISESYVD